jgi:UDP-N-acetylmuramoyl-tripeptide--D-alanyl-D-alanine ligase
MAAVFTAEEIMDITEARLAVGMMHEDLGEICTDTRELKEGQWFIALPGLQFDGHDFLGEAFSSGAIGCIVEERTSYPIASTSFPLLAVPSTEEALKKLARNWRRRLNPRIAMVPFDDSLEILVDFLGGDFTERFDTAFVPVRGAGMIEIFNGLLAMPDETKALLIEYRLRSLEELENVGDAVIPTVVLVTNESIESFRLQLTDKDLASIPFSILPTLRLNHGLVLLDAAFDEQILCAVDQNFLRNILLFGRSASFAADENSDGSEFLVAAAKDDSKLLPVIGRAKKYAEQNAGTIDQFHLNQLAAVVMQMMGVEMDAEPTS